MTRCALFAICLFAASCGKKDEASATAPVTSASVAAPVALPTPTEPSPVPDSVKIAATAVTPTEPNAPPAHEEHDRASAAEIHSNNYKTQLDSLEKEDLSADRK